MRRGARHNQRRSGGGFRLRFFTAAVANVNVDATFCVRLEIVALRIHKARVKHAECVDARTDADGLNFALSRHAAPANCSKLYEISSGVKLSGRRRPGGGSEAPVTEYYWANMSTTSASGSGAASQLYALLSNIYCENQYGRRRSKRLVHFKSFVLVCLACFGLW